LALPIQVSINRRAATAAGDRIIINVEHSTLDPTFDSALGRLDSFIKENFKVEEIYAAEATS
jgi:hypothetical protein